MAENTGGIDPEPVTPPVPEKPKTEAELREEQLEKQKAEEKAAEKTQRVTLIGRETLNILGIGTLVENEPVDINEKQAADVAGVGRPDILIMEKVTPLKGEEKEAAVEAAATQAVKAGDLPPAEKEVAVESNLKPKKVKE